MVTDRQTDSECEDAVGSCFGFTVQSDLPFRFLRKGPGSETLQVIRSSKPLDGADATLLYEWTIRDEAASVAARLYRADGFFYFWTSDAGWYRVDPRARRIEISDHPDELRREQRLWGVPTALCVKDRGDLAIHAATVEAKGSAIVLAAPGRFGKTTLALAFHRNGYRLLTEDTTCCTLRPGPMVFPGPTSVRLRPDMFEGAPPRGTNIAAVRDDRVHLMLDADRAGNGRPVPIAALVFLRESADDVRLDRVGAVEALPDLWTLTLRFQTDAERRDAFRQLTQLAANVPIWNLHRPFQVGTLDQVVDTLVSTCIR